MLNKKLLSGNLRTGGKLEPRQVEYIYTVLHMALEQALKNQLVTRNICDAVDKPKKDKHEFTPWTTEQTNQFLTSVKNSRLFSLYMVAWGSGLRRSEILGLQWEDIDLKIGALTVKRSLVRIKGGYKLGAPKTKKSKRPKYNPLNMVFCNEIGEPTTRTRYHATGGRGGYYCYFQPIRA